MTKQIQFHGFFISSAKKREYKDNNCPTYSFSLHIDKAK